jgi:hypothetical protein
MVNPHAAMSDHVQRPRRRSCRTQLLTHWTATVNSGGH